MASRIDSNPEYLLKALVHNARLHGAVEPGTPPWALAWLLESRTPTREQWEHAAQLIFRWMAKIPWYQASEDVRQCYRTRAAQVGVELGLIDG